MKSLRERKAIIRKARAILRETPAARARARARAERERATAKAREALARAEARRMIERSKALDRIDQVLGEVEEQLSWILYGRSRWSR